ncbi:hypothetical protein ACWEQL_41520 [Kitasatospora sp. NPDC004240]
MSRTDDPIRRTRARIAGTGALACLAFTLWTWIDQGSAERFLVGQPASLAVLVLAALLGGVGTVLAARPVHLPAWARRTLVLSFVPVNAALAMSALRLLVDPVAPGDTATGWALVVAIAALLMLSGCIGRIPRNTGNTGNTGNGTGA